MARRDPQCVQIPGGANVACRDSVGCSSSWNFSHVAPNETKAMLAGILAQKVHEVFLPANQALARTFRTQERKPRQHSPMTDCVGWA